MKHDGRFSTSDNDRCFINFETKIPAFTSLLVCMHNPHAPILLKMSDFASKLKCPMILIRYIFYLKLICIKMLWKVQQNA